MPQQAADILIKNAKIIDGTGKPRFDASVAITGNRIVKVGACKGWLAKNTIDAAGLVLTPGFIDTHTHDDRLMLSDRAMRPKVSQGITTVVAGNCGISLAPSPEPMKFPVTPPLNLLDKDGKWFRFPNFVNYVDALTSTPPATNSALLVGHTTLRVATMTEYNRAATTSEINAMKLLLKEALEAGAIGLSTGLAYTTAIHSSTNEVIELAKIAGSYNGIYCTHLRDEGDDVMEALEEAFFIGKAADTPVILSHHKVAGVPNFGRSRETLAYIEEAMQRQEIGMDCYPYSASSTVLSADKSASALKVIITWSQAHPEMAGRELSDIQKEWGCSLIEAVDHLLPAGAVYQRMDEADVERILAFDKTMVGSDGLPHDEVPHPRLWGTFPRVLGYYSRQRGLFDLEQAVHKMTALSARTFGLQDRGQIRENAFADLVLLDPEHVIDTASFERPVSIAEGVHSVFVNGEAVWENNHETGRNPGMVLQRRNCMNSKSP